MLAAVILAAGESRRMGTPKALLRHPQSGVTFLEHLLHVTAHPRVTLKRVVLGAHADEVRARVPLQSSAVLVNEHWQQGQLSSIQLAVRSLPAKIEGMLLCPVDHPLVSADLVARIIVAFTRDDKKIVLPTFDGKRGHPLIFPAAMFPELLAAPPDTGARAVVWAHPDEVLEIPTEEKGVVLNLNDPDTLKRIS